MIKIIIESGATSSSIAILKNEYSNIIKYKPLNGNLHSIDYINSYFKELSNKFNSDALIYFYGAGTNGIGGEKISHSMNKYFSDLNEIHSDLMGSCRALLGNKSGHVAILGTGSNCCFYKNKKIVENRSGNGIILGDEGSGAYLGKLLIQDFLNDFLPLEIKRDLELKYELSKTSIINNVYYEDEISKWFGQFSKYIFERRNEKYFTELIQLNFRHFIQNTLKGFSNKIELPINFNGGIAYNYKKILEKELSYNGYEIGKITERSIEGLIEFHLT